MDELGYNVSGFNNFPANLNATSQEESGAWSKGCLYPSFGGLSCPEFPDEYEKGSYRRHKGFETVCSLMSGANAIYVIYDLLLEFERV